ncbi:MAG: MT-A70 family methyltransferase [Candidatus Odinarchaeota archaeon]
MVLREKDDADYYYTVYKENPTQENLDQLIKYRPQDHYDEINKRVILESIREENKQKPPLKQKTLLDFYEKAIQYIKIKDISVDERIRKSLNKIQVNRLSESINQIGLINPITITKKKRLVAGNHRLHACIKLGWEKIPCVITTIDDSLLLRLQEIDENLIRYELHYIERGQHLFERKQIFEKLDLVFNQGGDRKTDDFKLRQSQFENKNAFIEDTIKTTGIKERTIYEDLQIIENVDPNIQEFLKENDISKRDALKIARMPKEDQKKVKEVIEEKKVDDKHSFIDNAYAKVKKQKKPKKIPKLPEDKYNVIYADPPWHYEGGTTSNRIIENKYPTMKTSDICKLKIPSAKDSILFLWVTSPKLEEGLEVMNMWGFTYKTSMVWVKDKIGMGYYARGRHEFILIGTKGSIGAPDPQNRPDSVIEAPRKEHSEKPEIMYELIEQMYPNHKYLELFARKKRENWESWGDEI